MTISTSIQTLLSGGLVAGSRLSRLLLDELMAEGLLQVVTHRSRKTYRARDTEALRRYLIDKDERYRVLETDGTASRAAMAAETGNSKLMTVRSCPGFPVNSYHPVECSLGGRPFVVSPPEGSFVFIDHWQQFVIPADVTVVGIENMENFRLIRRQQRLFESLLGNTPLLFVSRYPQSADLRRWLQSIPNSYAHFGDFDLAGIHIFLSEFHRHIGQRASFLIPTDIETRIAKGSPARYDSQYAMYSTLHSDQPPLQALIDLIHKYRRGYDQEGYIENDDRQASSRAIFTS